MAQGFLAVSTRPSAQLPVSEFHAWYEEEHIPIRLNKLDAFLSGARYYAIDGDPAKLSPMKPNWLAIYELSSTEIFFHSSYTSLREKRSERERDVMQRLEVLVRRTGGVVGIWGEPYGDGGRTTGLRVGRPSGYVVTHGVKFDGVVSDDNDTTIREWAEGVVNVKKANYQATSRGWVRMHVVKVLESGKTRMGAGVGLDEDEQAGYFVVHEFVDEESAMSEDFKQWVTHAVDEKKGDLEVTINDCRVWKLYKAYPSIAQGNVELL